MATMVLSSAGAAVGGALGGPMGAIIGQTLGALGGAWIDQQIFGENRELSVGKLGDLQLQTAAEGASLPFIYGRVRVTGNIIWATRLEEVVSEEKQGGKATGSSTTITSHSYFANFAVALCEGPITAVRRVWANGKEQDTSAINMRVYLGAEDQQPDPLIEAKQGTAPAYKSTAYVVFERLPLAEFGNRIPQLAIEVLRSIEPLEQQIKAVTLIPGAGEFTYHPQEVIEELAPGNTQSVNRHGKGEETDMVRSLDELQALCPNLKSVALVVAWFGDDLRASQCTIQPKVIYQTTKHLPENWSVAGLTRAEAQEVSRINDRPAYGGTPSDISVTEAIKELKRRGLAVMFYPFVMMDIPDDNQLPDPYGVTKQSSFPWRGRITSDIAAGQPGTQQGTSAVTPQIDAFVGSGSDWRFRRFILHYANLVKEAGGVEAFLIGSEMRGLTQCWAGGGTFPFVDHLKILATEVRQIVGSQTKLSYAADWSEYAGHSPQSGDLRFPLDPLWAHADINFVGIDNYLPLSDLRQNDDPQTAYNLKELREGVASGEYYDWYYANGTDRAEKTAARLQTEPTTSHGCSGKKTLRTGGRTSILNVLQVLNKTRQPPGCHNPNPSGSPSSAFLLSIKERTSPMSSWILNLPKAHCRTSPAGNRMTLSSVVHWKQASVIGEQTIRTGRKATIQPQVPTQVRWSMRTTPSSGHGTPARSPSSRHILMSGQMVRTGSSAIG